MNVRSAVNSPHPQPLSSSEESLWLAMGLFTDEERGQGVRGTEVRLTLPDARAHEA